MQGSVNQLANDRFSQLLGSRVLANVLLGVNSQINCQPCMGAFGSAGSFSAGAHGRIPINDNLMVLLGVGYNQREHNGYEVRSSGTIAGSLRYDFVEWGRSRPFIEVGGYVTPQEKLRYTRSYLNGAGQATGVGETTSMTYGVFGRLGWVWRLTPVDEVAVMTDLGHMAQRVANYAEPLSPTNPFEAAVSSGADRLNTWRIGAQWTHLWYGRVETNLNASVVRTFNARSGLSIAVAGFGALEPSVSDVTFFEYGGRIGWRLQKNAIVDLFANAQTGPQPVGHGVHGGIGFRYTF